MKPLKKKKAVTRKPIAKKPVAKRPVSRPAPKRPAAGPPTPAQGPVAGPPPPGIQSFGGAPPTLQGESARIDAGADYGTTLAGVNRGLMEAALRYGGTPQVQQFGYDPTGGDTSTLLGITTNPDDNSAMSTIAREEKLAAKGIDQSQNAQNTFFSSNRLGALSENQSTAGRRREDALREYNAAVAELVGNLMSARDNRESGIRNAGITDIQAAESVEPPAAVPQPIPEKSKPKAGFQFVQDKGTRAGLSYKLRKRGNRWFKIYENGDEVVRA